MTCFHGHIYPLTAIVGQEKMKLSLILNAIDPGINGVLIRGERGTAKSTVVRALADLLPEISVVEGCRYGCDPGNRDRMCPDCKERLSKGETLTAVSRKTKVVNLPINATQDRVAGTLDIERAIKKGEKRFEPGILAEANRGILYVDEVNLLGDHIVDILLDSAAMGVNVVERESVSYAHPAHFILIGTMNPEEGELRPQLLDRFGLCVDVEGIREPKFRVDVIKRRVAYEKDPHEFCHKWDGEQAELSSRIMKAKRLLPEVTVSDEIMENIARITVELGVDGHRADIIMMKAASAIAAFNYRSYVTEDDIKEAASLVYPHRLRKRPFDDQGDDSRIREAVDSSMDAPVMEKNESSAPQEKVHEIGKQVELPAIMPKRASEQGRGQGKRVKAPGDAAGVYVRSEELKKGDTDIAFDATLRSAAPYQKSRARTDTAIAIETSDLKKKVREKKTGSTIMLVVDASGSMGAKERMEAAKGAVMTLLIDAYQRRDRVGMVAFRGSKAEVLLQPTSSVELARKSLETLPTGGKTPLGDGLRLGIDALKKELFSNPGNSPVLVLITDGKANVPMNGNDPVEEAICMAKKLREENITGMIIDTENDFINLGMAKTLAEAAGATYHKMDGIGAVDIAGVARGGR